MKSTSLKAIAADAGVSPALVLHHFGSKDALRAACDKHVAAVIREKKTRAVTQGPGLDPFAALRESTDDLPVLRYLARTLTDGSPEVAALVDELVDDAVGYSEAGVQAGMLTPTEHPRERMAVITLWSLGALVLHDHMERLLGADVISGKSLLNYMRPASEILGEGVIAGPLRERLKEALRDPPPEGDST